MIEVTAKTMEDYLHLQCGTCGQATENEYIGGPAPSIRATCPTCGESTTLKLGKWLERVNPK